MIFDYIFNDWNENLDEFQPSRIIFHPFIFQIPLEEGIH